MPFARVASGEIEQNLEGKVMTYMPECLRNLPKPKPGRKAATNRRKINREMSELAVLECIQRIKAAKRSAPRDWERGYNSAITQLELFLGEIKGRKWMQAETV